MIRAQSLAATQLAARFGHVPCLDGLRAISILFVLGDHFVGWLVFERIFGGTLGVSIFFVISGFLISRLLFAEDKLRGTISFRLFYLRRIVRLYPPVLAYLAVTSTAILLFEPRQFDGVWALGVLFYYSNVINYIHAIHHIPGAIWPYGAFCSLAIEEQFYIVFPIAILLLRKRPSAILVAALVVCVLSPILRISTAAAHPDLLDTLFIYYRTDLRMDAIASGVALSCLCELEGGRKIVRVAASRLAVVAALATLLLMWLITAPFFLETIRYSLQALFGVILISVTALSGRANLATRILNSKPAEWLGRLSYSLYVWQGAAVGLSYFALHLRHTTLGHALVIFLTFLLAMASYYGIERPISAARRRLSAATEMAFGRQRAFATL